MTANQNIDRLRTFIETDGFVVEREKALAALDALAADLDAAIRERNEAMRERDLYEVMTKAVERALFGTDIGRRREEIVAKAESVEARVAELERELDEARKLLHEFASASVVILRAESAEARVTELEAALRRIASPDEITGDGPLEPILADPVGCAAHELKSRMGIARAALAASEIIRYRCPAGHTFAGKTDARGVYTATVICPECGATAFRAAAPADTEGGGRG